jgi:peptidoglycan-associated lipoprotein
MRMKLTALAGVLLLIAACETAPEDTGAQSGGGTVRPTPSPSPTEEMMTPEPQLSAQEDLVQNVGDRVFFDFDRAAVRADGEATLRRQADFLNARPDVGLIIEGHCDERGTREYNLALGERRATAAKNFLVSLGISPTRISTISYGKERPPVLGHNSAAWAQNRTGISRVN